MQSGIGGYPLNINSGTKIFMGGGGGAGHQNDGVGSSGANGGGIIMIKANQIIGNGFSIIADGANAGNSFNKGNDGLGGGGAGGSIQLKVLTLTNILNINANGGKGGNMINWECHGPGGGGGGGIICTSLATFPSYISTSLLGGANGIVSDSCEAQVGDLSYGATKGADGILQTNCETAPVTDMKKIVPSLGGDLVLCNPISFTLNAGISGPWYSYLWKKNDLIISGSNSQTLNVSSPGKYTVEISSSGCQNGTDTINVTSNTSIPVDTMFCAPTSGIQFKVIGSGIYNWWDAPVGGTKLNSIPSSTFTSPAISSTTTYYVEDISLYSQGGFTPVNRMTAFNIRTGNSRKYMGFDALNEFTLDSVTIFVRTYNTNTDSITIQLMQGANLISSKTIGIKGICNCQIDWAKRIGLGFKIPKGTNYHMDYAIGNVNVHWDDTGTLPCVCGNSGTQTYPFTLPGIVKIYGPVNNLGANISEINSYGFFYDWKLSARTICDRVPVIANNNCVLPVELLNFSAANTMESVLLNWSTSNEKDNDHFNIERSEDGIYFEVIGRVNGQGSTSSVSIYSFTDSKPITGVSYYRLAQYDTDGLFIYSKIISVNRSLEAEISLYPNPFSNQSNLYVPSVLKSKVFVKLSDLTGRNVSSYEINSNELISIGQTLPAGVYILQILWENNSKVIKFIKSE